MSLPVWEEWIEIVLPGVDGDADGSLPVWEEWIEIAACLRVAGGRSGLFPYGKSGLKSRRCTDCRT